MSANGLIQGLNLVQPHSSPTGNPTNDLLAHPYPDLAQLDLWTNVSFASDEPLVPADRATPDDLEDKSAKDSSTHSADIVKKKRDLLAKKTFPGVHSTTIPPSPAFVAAAAAANASIPPGYDLPSLLAMTSNQFSSPADALNLNSLLFGTPFPNGGFHFTPGVNHFQPPVPTPTETADAPPPAKKARARKSSTSVGSPAESEEPGSPADSRFATSAEDKRKRNTQASARFRLKKKEREQHMEVKCKELEGKVTELEKECEALRRENGWLKGLVVGVTGGTGMPMSMPTGPGLPTMQQPQSNSSKRKRDADAA